MKFQKYINEGNTSAATNMEISIVQKANDEKLTYSDQEEIASNIVEFLNKNGIKGKAKHLGSGSFPITDF
jgi:hypothetical protein